jgi:prolyl-tRNA synthetase
MGCYGIGISRVLAACIEQNHDENGIIYPPAIAPWEVLIVAINPKDEKVFSAAVDIHDRLQGAGVECLLDDRAERPGVKFKDADLIGIPVQVVVGAKGLERGVVEIKVRKTGEKTEVALENLTGELARIREKLWSASGISDKNGE